MRLLASRVHTGCIRVSMNRLLCSPPVCRWAGRVECTALTHAGLDVPMDVMTRCSRYSSSSTSRAPAPALVFALAFVFVFVFVFAATVLTRLLSSRTCPRTRPHHSGPTLQQWLRHIQLSQGLSRCVHVYMSGTQPAMMDGGMTSNEPPSMCGSCTRMMAAQQQALSNEARPMRARRG